MKDNVTDRLYDFYEVVDSKGDYAAQVSPSGNEGFKLMKLLQKHGYKFTGVTCRTEDVDCSKRLLKPKKK